MKSCVIEVYDYNSFLSKNILIGIHKIENFSERIFVDKINKWGINKVIELQDPKNLKEKYLTNNFGGVYLKIGFLDQSEKSQQIIDPTNIDVEKYSEVSRLS